MTSSRVFVIDRGDARRRLDRVLQDRLPQSDASRARIQRWIESGRVTIDGVVQSRPARRVVEGQSVDVRVPAAPRRRHAPEPLALDVLYEDDTLLAVNKPAGLVVHPTRRYPTGTLVNALLWHLREWVDGGVGPRLVHRLDRETSGVMLVAKSRETHAALARAMARRHVRKEYLAVVYGLPRVNRDRIDLRIGRNTTGRLIASKNEGRPCSTSYQLVARSDGARAGVSLLRCTLGTGRLHQIRVHLSAIGLPLVGDPLYGEPRWKGVVDPACAQICAAFPRQALHAWRLELPHPVTGRPLALEAPVPDDLSRLLTAVGIEPSMQR
jgi:23S rRNA pseudouridine1911/1915/1917 synthase